MYYVELAVPILMLAAIVGLPLRAALRGRTPRPRRAQAPRPRRNSLRDVSRSQMDQDLQDLIRRKS
jgi:hypothetical protein